jgi:hypothetical protein
MGSFDVKKLCTPAKVYLVVSVVSVLIALFRRSPVTTVLVQFLFVLLWTFALNWLCSKGYKNVSWFLVVLPYVMLFFGMTRMVEGLIV